MIFVIMLSFFSIPASAAVKKAESPFIQAVKQKPLEGYFGINFANSVPQKAFYSNMRQAGIGFSMNGGGWIANSPLAIGGSLGFLFFNSDEQYFPTYRSGWFLGNDTVSTNSMEIPLTMTIRFQPATNWIRPYFEGFGGGNFFVTSGDFKSYEGIHDSKDKFSAAWIYGIGGGVDIRVSNSATATGQHNTVNITLGINYSKGSNVKYYKAKINEDSSVDFDAFKSQTDQIITTIGVSFGF